MRNLQERVRGNGRTIRNVVTDERGNGIGSEDDDEEEEGGGGGGGEFERRRISTVLR